MADLDVCEHGRELSRLRAEVERLRGIIDTEVHGGEATEISGLRMELESVRYERGLYVESIRLMRWHLKQVGIEAPFVDDVCAIAARRVERLTSALAWAVKHMGPEPMSSASGWCPTASAGWQAEHAAVLRILAQAVALLPELRTPAELTEDEMSAEYSETHAGDVAPAPADVSSTHRGYAPQAAEIAGPARSDRRLAQLERAGVRVEVDDVSAARAAHVEAAASMLCAKCSQPGHDEAACLWRE